MNLSKLLFGAFVLLASLVPATAQETDAPVLRYQLKAPILFSSTGNAEQPQPDPLVVELDGVPVWAPLGSDISATLTATGGTTPYGLPTAIGSAVGPTSPVAATASTWDIDGTWSTPGTQVLEYSISDGGGQTDTDSATIEVGLPLAAANTTIIQHVSSPVSFQATTGGYSTGRQTDLTNLPAWLSHDPSTSTISGTMPATAGSVSVGISAEDGFTNAFGAVTLQTVAAPVASISGSPSGPMNTAMTITPTLANAIGAVTWSVTGALPPGMTMPSTSTGVISGTPTTAGSYPVTLRGQDSASGSHEIPVDFSIVAPPNWTAMTTPSAGWSGIGYGNGQFVAVGTNKVMTSPDGITWTNRTAPSGEWRSVAYGNGIYVAVAANGNSSSSVMTSSNGITWTMRTSVSSQWQSVAFGNGVFVAVGWNSNGVMSSTNGTSWTARTSPVIAGTTASGMPSWSHVLYTNGSFYAVSLESGAAGLMKSTDGTTWTAASTPVGGRSAIAYGNGKFIAIGTGNVATTSVDGTTWSAGVAPASGYIPFIAYGGGAFVAVGSSQTNRIFTTTDGVTWTARTAGSSVYFNGVAYGGGAFVAVGGTGVFRATSP